MMKKMHHPNIAKLHEVINDPSYHKIYLVIDFCEMSHIMDWDDNDLSFYVRNEQNKYTEKEIANIFSQVILGLDYLHSIKIVHRDLKPQNILECKDGTIKIGDFDLAT